MSNVRRSISTRLADPEGPGGWLLVGCVVAYIAATCWWRTVWFGPGVGFLPAWIALAAVSLGSGCWLAARSGRRLRPLEASVLLAWPGMVLTDLSGTYQPLRDLGIYLKAGQHFLSGAPVYIQSTIDARPADLTNYPFLYPPMTLPFFGVLSLLPTIVAQAIWVAGSLALGLAALRLMGLRWRWVLLAPLWPPLFQGLWVGNVVVPALALFALAPRLGGGLVLGAVFKSYTGIAAMWLVRERRWRGLAAGLVGLAGLAVATLPLTGTRPWLDWIEGLRLYQVSQQDLPALYGFGLMEFVPLWGFVGLAVLAVVAALAAGGREGLARLGTATIVASPSLWAHGMLVAVPSLLYLAPAWLWLGLAITSSPEGIQWWSLVALVAVSWAVPWLRRDVTARPEAAWLDPLADGASGAWPDMPDRERGPAASVGRRRVSWALPWASGSGSGSESAPE